MQLSYPFEKGYRKMQILAYGFIIKIPFQFVNYIYIQWCKLDGLIKTKLIKSSDYKVDLNYYYFLNRKHAPSFLPLLLAYPVTCSQVAAYVGSCLATGNWINGW